MIVIVKQNACPQQVENLKKELEGLGLQIHFSKGEHHFDGSGRRYHQN